MVLIRGFLRVSSWSAFTVKQLGMNCSHSSGFKLLLFDLNARCCRQPQNDEFQRSILVLITSRHHLQTWWLSRRFSIWVSQRAQWGSLLTINTDIIIINFFCDTQQLCVATPGRCNSFASPTYNSNFTLRRSGTGFKRKVFISFKIRIYLERQLLLFVYNFCCQLRMHWACDLSRHNYSRYIFNVGWIFRQNSQRIE